MKRLRLLLTLLLPVLLLLPTSGTSAPRGEEAPWREGGWAGAFAVPRPTLPGQPAFLESAGPIPTELRLRLHRVEDPEGFLRKLLASEPGSAALEGARAGSDPLDILREAFLWGARRAFVTVHRTASRELKDLARQSERLHAPRSEARDPREGHALPLEAGRGLRLVTELVPQVTEEISKADGAEERERGHLSRVALPAQPAGLYLVELLRGSEAAYVPWLVTDLALLAEEDGASLRLTAVSAQDGALREGVSGALFEKGKATALDFRGAVAERPAGPGLRRVALAKAGASLALLSIEGQASAAVRQRLYAFTERPLYRPGQEVFAKVILRGVDEGENRVVKGVPELPFTVLDPEDTKVAEGRARLLNAETGTYGCSFPLPGAGRLGLHRIVFQAPGGPGQAEFKVEHFVKPAFSVAVEAAQTKLGVGDPLRFAARARYFYGAAVRNAQASWFLYKVVPRRSYWGEEDEGPAPELVESGEGKLDAEGVLELPDMVAKEEGLWRLTVKVTDGAGQQNSGSAQARASTGDLVLFVATDRNVAAPGQPFQATAKALDLDGAEQRVPITLKVARIQAERSDAGLWWSRPTSLKPGQVLASAPGPSASLRVGEGGVFLVVAEAHDRSGRLVRAQRLLTVAAEGTPLPSVPDLRVSADRASYQPGDVARVLVQLPVPRLTLHWSLEHEKLGERHSRRVEGTTAVVEIPVTAAMQPNAWIVFETVSGGRRQLAELPLRVPRLDRRLRVDVKPDRERYQPGQPMRLVVEVKDHQGRPASADLSVGVVDEAIYALSPELNPDPVRFFHPSRRHGVVRAGSTEWSFWDILRRQRPVWSLRQTKRGEFKSDDADKVRQNFKDTAHWAPLLAVGRDGRASTELVLPDNLTAWRATATAVTPDTKVGVGRAVRPSSKPLQVSLTLPRTLSAGEEARAIALVRNLSGRPFSGTVRLEVQHGRFGPGAEASFQLQDQQEHRLSVPLHADAAGQLTVTARVEGGGLKDAERRSVKVLDPTVPASLSGSVLLTGEVRTVEIPPPPGARGGAAFSVVPVAGLEQQIVPSLPYLVQYPYGCVEQTLSSFVPNLLVADLVKRGLMPPLDWKQLVDLDRNIREGVFKVYGYQQPGGGWGWYAPNDFGMEANPHTTGYAIASFADMKRLGYAVDEGVDRRGRQAALRLFQDVARQADARQGRPRSAGERGALDPAADAAFLLASLAHAGEPIRGLLDSSADKVLNGSWPGSHVLALVALAAAEAQHPKAAALAARLEQVAQHRGGLVSWESGAEGWHGYAGGDLAPTLNALKALCLARPKSALIPAAEAFVASRHQGYGWCSTWATSQAVGLLPALAKVRPLQWKGADVSVALAGGPSWDFKGMDARPGFRREARLGHLSLPSPQALRFTAQGRGLLVWTYAYQVPGSAKPPMKAEASALGALRLGLQRHLWRLRTPQETGNSARGWVRSPWTGQMKVGDEAWMELTVQTDQPVDYAVLEIPIPAGLDPRVKLEGFVLEGHPFSDGDAADRWDKPRIEVHPDRVAVFFERLWGASTVRLHLRAGMAGSYRLRPARLSLMGDETRWVTCEGVDLKVGEGGAR